MEIDGSVGPSPIHNKFEIVGIYLSNVCPKPTITALSIHFLKLHKHYKCNILPYSGGILEQPNPFMEAMEIIETYAND